MAKNEKAVPFRDIPDGGLFRVVGEEEVLLKLWQPVRVSVDSDNRFVEGDYFWAVGSDGKPRRRFEDVKGVDSIKVIPERWPWKK